MRIEEITKTEAFIVETDEEDYYVYKRYSSDNWDVRMGESWEPVYDKDKTQQLEKLFQEFRTQIAG